MIKCKIEDWYNLHPDYITTLIPGYTTLVGPNGSGKTTMLEQLKAIGNSRGYCVYHYSNEYDAQFAKEKYLQSSMFMALACSIQNSEGQNITANFSNLAIGEIKKTIIEASKKHTHALILLDGLDSGLSIDKQRELLNFLKFVVKDSKEYERMNGTQTYIVAAVNGYEMLSKNCINVATGKRTKFRSYSEYTDFIMSYIDTYLKKIDGNE